MKTVHFCVFIDLKLQIFSCTLYIVFAVVEAKRGTVRPENTMLFEDDNSDSENEDVVETLPKPSIKVQGFSPPAFPSPEPLLKPTVRSFADLDLTKVSSFVLLFF